MSLKDWSVTADSNTSAPPNGWPEGMALANVNNNGRKMMADVRNLAAPDTIAAVAGTTDIGAKDATILTTTGTAVTITGLGTVSAGIYKFVIYNAAHTLTYNATSMILLGNASRTVAAGDVSLFVSEGSGNWRELVYSPDGGYQPLDADLTAIAALTTTATGRSLLEIASAASGRTIIDAARLTSSLTAVTPDSNDYVHLSDVSDAGSEKKALVSDLFAQAGLGGTWQAVSPIPASGTSIQNTNAKPIAVMARSDTSGTGLSDFSMQVSADNSTWLNMMGDSEYASNSSILSGFLIVPPGHYYKYTSTFGLDYLQELK